MLALPVFWGLVSMTPAATAEAWDICQVFVAPTTRSEPATPLASRYDQPTADLPGAVEAICDAVDAGTCAGGNVILFPGTYALSETIDIDCSLLTLRGLSADLGTPQLEWDDTVEVGIDIGFSSQNQPRLEGINVEGLALSSEDGSDNLVRVRRVDSIRLMGLDVYDAGIDVADSVNVHLSECSITDSPVVLDAITGLRVSDTDFVDNGYGDPMSISDSTQVLVTANSLTAPRLALELSWSTGSEGGTADIINNQLTATASSGSVSDALFSLSIDTDEDTRTTVANNVLGTPHSGLGVDLDDDCGDVFVDIVANTIGATDRKLALDVSALGSCGTSSTDTAVRVHNNVLQRIGSVGSDDVALHVSSPSGYGWLNCWRNSFRSGTTAVSGPPIAYCSPTSGAYGWVSFASTALDASLYPTTGANILSAGLAEIDSARALPYTDALGQPRDGSPPAAGAYATVAP